MFRQFLSTLSLRRATRRGGDLCYLDNIISIHALLAESDQGQQGFVERCAISIHALLAESDSSNFLPPLGPPYFYPRSPCGERRCEPWPPHRTTQFLSTLSLRRATSAQAAFPPGECISIHALLAESDGGDAAAGDCTAISIHALLAESDGGSDKYKGQALEFLSTLSLRRATVRD